jgi:tetratricopeptide (TPR) repeat protein
MKYYSKSALAAILFTGFLVPAFAAGDAPATDTPDTTKVLTDLQKAEKKCKDTKGKVWDIKNKKCVDQAAMLLDDESIYETGRYLAVNGRYDEAITVLDGVANPNDKRVLTYLGYSYRKSGQIDVGMKYYADALAVDPNYVLVREYLGEAYLQKGDLAAARNQLAEIETRCGETCGVYVDLAKKIDLAAKI